MKSFTKIATEVNLDFGYFQEIPLDEYFKKTVYEFRLKYRLKALDLIQLSSAKISNAQIILVSDNYLHKIAAKELTNVHFI